ncbi:MAG: glycosyltransferase [Selenomonadaceae bacterium]|nr:glycosyltransferase [Selenomonadaceae bacterium]
MATNETKISACYIVKNESKNLRRSLNSLHEVDEIIVVDTGSEDDTLEVAKEFGAKIFHETWQEDFSAPRNVALSHATGDWIVFLDADEYFTDKTANNLRIVIEKFDKTKVNGLLIYIVNVDEDKEDTVIDTTFTLRIFRNLKGLKYVGKIHENLKLNGFEFPKVMALPVKFLTINHTGYSSSINKAKAERNLKIILAEMETTDSPQAFYGHLAQCYYGLDDFNNAEKFAKMDIESGVVQSTFASRSYRILLSVLSSNTDRNSEKKEVLEKTVEKFPDIPEFCAELAEMYAAQSDYKKAVELMKRALDNYENYDGIEPFHFDNKLAEVARQHLYQWQIFLI